MSYDIYIKDAKTGERITFENPHDVQGGTYQLGGCREAWLNITYNYSKFYRDHIDAEQGIRWLYGKTVAECVPILMKARDELGTERNTSPFWQLNIMANDSWKAWNERIGDLDLDAPENRQLLQEAINVDAVRDGGAYWKPTPGNAGAALNDLICIAVMCPAISVFDGD